MPNLSRPQLVASCIIVGIALIGTAILVVRSVGAGQGGKEIRLIPADRQTVSTGESDKPPDLSGPVPVRETSGRICVHVVGRVRHTGVYYLPAGSRVVDAVHAAGGPLGDADDESINLAAKLDDGEQVLIASRANSPPARTSGVSGKTLTVQPHGAASVVSGKDGSSPGKLRAPGDGVVDVNTACVDELQRLPGIGPSMAQRIVDYRKEKGSFKGVEDLRNVKGIGPAKFTRIQPFIKL
jgi:competence protein ComEA